MQNVRWHARTCVLEGGDCTPALQWITVFTLSPLFWSRKCLCVQLILLARGYKNLEDETRAKAAQADTELAETMAEAKLAQDKVQNRI